MKLTILTPRKRQPTESEKRIQELFDEHDAIWAEAAIKTIRKPNGDADASVTKVFCGVKKNTEPS